MPEGVKPRTLRERLDQDWGLLWQEYGSHRDHHIELSRILPRRLRWDDDRRPQRSASLYQRVGDQLNNVALRSLRILASGMYGGLSSPNSRWLAATVMDAKLLKSLSVRQWLGDVSQRMLDVMSLTNFYQTFYGNYMSLGCFGVCCNVIDEDDETLLRARTQPVGSFVFGLDSAGRVNRMVRRVRMTSLQMVEEFGKENCSDRVCQEASGSGRHKWHIVKHGILPNGEHDPTRLDVKGKAWLSAWYDQDTNEDEARGQWKDQGLLRLGGYNEQPFAIARWGVDGNDYWGWSPAMDALGMHHGVQKIQERRLDGLNKIMKPPVAMYGVKTGTRPKVLPGGLTTLDRHDGYVKPIYTVEPTALRMGGEMITEYEEQIASTLFASLFLAITAIKTGDMTAHEVEVREQEKLQQLGPVVERVAHEKFDIYFNRTYGAMERAGMIPDPPPELEGAELKPQFRSVLANAQRLSQQFGMERLLQYIASGIEIYPEARHVYDFVGSVQSSAELLAVDAEHIRTDDQVDQAIAAEQEQQQQAQALEAMESMGRSAKDLSSADLEGDNALAAAAGLPPGALA